MRKTCTQGRKVSLLRDMKIRKRLDEEVIELDEVEVPSLFRHCNGGFKRHVMRCVGRRGGSEVKGIHGGGKSGEGDNINEERCTQGDVLGCSEDNGEQV